MLKLPEYALSVSPSGNGALYKADNSILAELEERTRNPDLTYVVAIGEAVFCVHEY